MCEKAVHLIIVLFLVLDLAKKPLLVIFYKKSENMWIFFLMKMNGEEEVIFSLNNKLYIMSDTVSRFAKQIRNI